MASQSVPVKRIYNTGWESLPAEEQATLRERFRALCAKDTEKGISDVSTFFPSGVWSGVEFFRDDCNIFRAFSFSNYSKK
jgi:hypothetical protein